jgi:hypothetical protein
MREALAHAIALPTTMPSDERSRQPADDGRIRANGREAAIGRKSEPSSYGERCEATRPRPLGLHSGASGDFPERAELAVLDRDEPGKSKLRALSPKKLPGPKLKAEIWGVRSHALLRLVAASLPLPLLGLGQPAVPALNGSFFLP